MIFLKKILILTVSAITAASFAGGCSLKKTVSSKSPSEPSTSASEQTSSAVQTLTEPSQLVTAPEVTPSKHEITPAEGVYVYDEAKVFSSDAYNACNDYAEVLYEKYLINAAVVTTDGLEGNTPYEYAAKAYEDIYSGRGSGLLLLINNDTGSDCLYLSGSCETYIPSDAQNEAFYWATAEIVDGDYKTAALRILQLGERCPEHVFDNAGLLSMQITGEIERILSVPDKDLAILLTSNSTDRTNEQILEEYYKRRCKDGTGIMAMIDSQSGKVIVHSSQTIPSELGSALKKANESAAAKDYETAARTIAEALAE